MKPITIAIDGFSSCGKSTMAKRLAKELGYIYVDTGAMYRAVTLYALQKGVIAQGAIDTHALIAALSAIHVAFTADGGVLLNDVRVDDAIRSVEVSQWVSKVSSIKEVRQKMVELQRAMGINKGVVMDGRDIGTVVFPDAELKVFVTADPKVRAQRRYDEWTAKGMQVNFDEVLQNVIDRDYQDQHRAESPLVQASDAIVLDNSYMTREEQQIWLMKQVEKVCCTRK
ncbi:MAG: (d)CMP kinase [Paludibacteraceae bacterium]|nr:(d)CMP kinase [Paludibacteraceae bacterium]